MRIQLLNKKPDSFDHTVLRDCKNCHNTFTGRFCNKCGEKVIRPEDKSIREFLGSILNAFTFLDNKFFFTLRLMLVKTGYVTSQYINGIRVPFIKPISMFFVVNLLYFLFPAADTFNSQLVTQMNHLPHSAVAKKMVEGKIKTTGEPLVDFTLRYNQQSTSMAKLLLIIYVVLMAVPIMILNYSKGKYFADHLMTSLEFTSLFILVTLIIMTWSILLLDLVFTPSTHAIKALLNDRIYSPVVAGVSIVLFYFMERRVYKQQIVFGIIKSVVLVICLIFCLQIYRAILFFATIWSL